MMDGKCSNCKWWLAPMSAYKLVVEDGPNCRFVDIPAEKFGMCHWRPHVTEKAGSDFCGQWEKLTANDPWLFDQSVIDL